MAQEKWYCIPPGMPQGRPTAGAIPKQGIPPPPPAAAAAIGSIAIRIWWAARPPISLQLISHAL